MNRDCKPFWQSNVVPSPLNWWSSSIRFRLSLFFFFSVLFFMLWVLNFDVLLLIACELDYKRERRSLQREIERRVPLKGENARGLMQQEKAIYKSEIVKIKKIRKDCGQRQLGHSTLKKALKPFITSGTKYLLLPCHWNINSQTRKDRCT